MANKVKLGIIGYGHIGSQHGRAIRDGKCPQVDLTAVLFSHGMASATVRPMLKLISAPASGSFIRRSCPVARYMNGNLKNTV